LSELITLDEIKDKLNFFNKMYDVVRIVDPVHKRVTEYCGNPEGKADEVCYAYWEKGKICDNCISVRAYQANKCYQKLEQAPETIMTVTAFPVEDSIKPAVLELLKNATETMIIGTGNYEEGRLLGNLVSELNDLVVKDELTGLFNRRYLNERLPADIASANLKKSPLSVIFLDIDNLKEINDTYGHPLGDEAIAGVAEALQDCIRADIDWACRYGGDEFLVCLINTASADVYRIAERIRLQIQMSVLNYLRDKIKITVSLGVYTMKGLPLTVEELIALTDEGMYKAKRQGGNRTVLIRE